MTINFTSLENDSVQYVHTTRLISREDYIKFTCRESTKTYIGSNIPSLRLCYSITGTRASYLWRSGVISRPWSWSFFFFHSELTDFTSYMLLSCHSDDTFLRDVFPHRFSLIGEVQFFGSQFSQCRDTICITVRNAKNLTSTLIRKRMDTTYKFLRYIPWFSEWSIQNEYK